jgi:hypothetical protein
MEVGASGTVNCSIGFEQRGDFTMLAKILGKKTTPSERELEKLRERRDVIYEKIAMAKATLNQAHAARNDMPVSAGLDDAAMERASAALRAAQDHLQALEEAPLNPGSQLWNFRLSVSQQAEVSDGRRC